MEIITIYIRLTEIRAWSVIHFMLAESQVQIEQASYLHAMFEMHKMRWLFSDRLCLNVPSTYAHISYLKLFQGIYDLKIKNAFQPLLFYLNKRYGGWFTLNRF